MHKHCNNNCSLFYYRHLLSFLLLLSWAPSMAITNARQPFYNKEHTDVWSLPHVTICDDGFLFPANTFLHDTVLQHYRGKTRHPLYYLTHNSVLFVWQKGITWARIISIFVVAKLKFNTLKIDNNTWSAIKEKTWDDTCISQMNFLSCHRE